MIICELVAAVTTGILDALVAWTEINLTDPLVLVVLRVASLVSNLHSGGPRCLILHAQLTTSTLHVAGTARGRLCGGVALVIPSALSSFLYFIELW